MVHVDDLIEPGPEHVRLPAVPPLLRTHPEAPDPWTRKPWNHARRRNAICKFLRSQTADTGKKQFFGAADQQPNSRASIFFTGDYWTINLGGRYRLVDGAGDFRLINRRFADALRSLPESERFMKGLYAWVGFRQRAISLTPPPRENGVSRFNKLRLLTISVDALTSFTTAPLRLMTMTGFCIALLSGLYGFYIVIERLAFESSGIGISSILTLISFLGGVQTIFLGLLGEYVGKAVLEAKGRPCYIIAADHQVEAGARRPSVCVR